jgi:hypothetical protein
MAASYAPHRLLPSLESLFVPRGGAAGKFRQVPVVYTCERAWWNMVKVSLTNSVMLPCDLARTLAALRVSAGTTILKSIVVLVFALLAPGAVGTTIYKSVDAQGRVTFSDQPPLAEELVDVIQYRESRQLASALATERIEAMREVTDRMAADRREREESRVKARANRLATRPDTRYYDDSDYGYSSGYYPVYHPRRIGPGGRPPGVRPPGVHPPIARPPFQHRPAHRQNVGINRYPASLIRRHYTSTARRVFYQQPYRSH